MRKDGSGYSGYYPDLIPMIVTPTKAPNTDSVQVDGVTLTREQVEDALKRLNAPPVPTFQCGDVVSQRSGSGLRPLIGVVLGVGKSTRVSGLCVKEWATYGDATLWVMGTGGAGVTVGQVYTWSPKDVLLLHAAVTK